MRKVHQMFDPDEYPSYGLPAEDDYPVIVEHPKNGYRCCKCNEQFPFAQPDKITGDFVCYYCRNYGT